MTQETIAKEKGIVQKRRLSNLLISNMTIGNSARYIQVQEENILAISAVEKLEEEKSSFNSNVPTNNKSVREVNSTNCFNVMLLNFLSPYIFA